MGIVASQMRPPGGRTAEGSSARLFHCFRTISNSKRGLLVQFGGSQLFGYSEIGRMETNRDQGGVDARSWRVDRAAMSSPSGGELQGLRDGVDGARLRG